MRLRPDKDPVPDQRPIPGPKRKLLAYLQMGNAKSTKTIVFVHGSTMTKEGMGLFAQAFKNYNCIVFDLPAHGESQGRKTGSIEECAASIEYSIEELRKHKKIGRKLWIAGYSLGGAITCEIALRKRIKINGIILLSTGANLDKYTPLVDEIKEKPASEFKAMDLFIHAFGQDTTEEQRTAILQGLEETKVSDEIGYEDLVLANAYNRIKDVKKLDIPAFIVHGDDDEIIDPMSAVDLWTSLKNSHLLLIPYRGHTVIFEQTDYVVEKISSFISKC